LFEVDPEVMTSPIVMNSDIAADLGFSEEYRLELSRAYAEVYLVRSGAAVASVMFHRPLRSFLDPRRIQAARMITNHQDPVGHHLNPILLQNGYHPF
jgi:hypothetical protein